MSQQLLRDFIDRMKRVHGQMDCHAEVLEFFHIQTEASVRVFFGTQCILR